MQQLTTIFQRFSPQICGNLIHHSPTPNTIQCAVPSAACLQRLKHTGTDEKSQSAQSESQFTGYIPVEEVEFSYSRSSGPGGQHVNKVNTKVELRFHLPSASWIPEDVKTKLMETEKNRITKGGYLVMNSERTRKQMLNQADAMDKLRALLFRAASKPRGLTEEETELRDKRLAKAKEKVLREKRQQALKKQSRGSANLGSF